jgi:hypothetical protein
MIKISHPIGHRKTARSQHKVNPKVEMSESHRNDDTGMLLIRAAGKFHHDCQLNELETERLK